MSAGVVFVGPSCRAPYPEIANVEFRAPAARGDLLRAVDEGARVIGLVDGVFHQTLAVSPTEVRVAAGRGARLLGGASLGALRACECPREMQGVGVIWAAFARGELADDDEVAVTFLPDTYEVVAYPLVQVREAARLAVAGCAAARELEQGFVEAVRSLPFQERTLRAIRVAAGDLEAVGVTWAELERWLTHRDFDLKRRDALEVINAMARLAVYRGRLR
jgi:hypothetical protein